MILSYNYRKLIFDLREIKTMLNRKVFGFGLALAMAISAISAQAHHSFSATFTDEIITVEGYVEKMSFSNPHVIIYFNSTDEAGNQLQWMSEGGAATLLRNRGWSRDSLVEGDYIRVTGNSTRNGSPMVSMEEINLVNPSNGAIVGTPGEQVTETVAVNNSLPMQRADGLPNLTGAWTNAVRNRPTGAARDAGGPPGAGGGPPGRGGPAMPYNEMGAALQAQYDPINDPQVQCEPPGLVRQSGFTPHPYRIEQFDDHVVISYEEYGSVRTIYFDDRELVGGDHTHLGQSIARYKGQTLIVETTHLLGNLTSPNGNALTDQTTTVETYSRSADENSRSVMNMEMVVTDPGYLTATHTLTSKKPYTADYEFIEVDCHKPLAY
jgi:hypothetical protein